eukprot:COSAG02_NODE_2019_length_10091_cov_13.354283_7_plen_79_part_00
MYCSRTLTPSGGRVEQLRGGALGAMVRTKKVLTRAEAKAMALPLLTWVPRQTATSMRRRGRSGTRHTWRHTTYTVASP